ncbi:hypothetical protein [Anaerocolumna sp. MB42-C2]|uniref:hypothetical protein n=1 Tax=Anaerocolumna sp. MB42-C2 TaxID=3070997 RepID=UPI0027E047B6|nr:hypothetical protein [Anaerocolumna sp. MB42-C2]WMJ87329.1 hypothetical protein RBU59_25365 [Anaerocolumna sp. MB42-C2]
MKQELKVNIFVNIEKTYQSWDLLSDEERKKIGAALNEKALRAIGYIPASEIKGKQSKMKN